MSSATIGTALSARRQQLGIDQKSAANKIGMSRTTYSSYEHDAQRPSVEVFPALADFLDINIEEFLVLYGASAIAVVRPSLERVLQGTYYPSVEPSKSIFAQELSQEPSSPDDANYSEEVSMPAPQPFQPEAKSKKNKKKNKRKKK